MWENIKMETSSCLHTEKVHVLLGHLLVEIDPFKRGSHGRSVFSRRKHGPREWQLQETQLNLTGGENYCLWCSSSITQHSTGVQTICVRNSKQIIRGKMFQCTNHVHSHKHCCSKLTDSHWLCWQTALCLKRVLDFKWSVAKNRIINFDRLPF